MAVVAAVGIKVFGRSHASAGQNVLYVNQTLYTNQSLYSSGGGMRLVMQGDGNLVLYTAASIPVWWTSTSGSNNRLVMQSDGNLVVYTSANQAVWNSRTSGTGNNNRLILQSDGNLVLYKSTGGYVWNSGTPSTQINAASWTALQLYHQVGYKCPEDGYGFSDWCANSPTSSYVTYGPYYNLSATALHSFPVVIKYFWTYNGGSGTVDPVPSNDCAVMDVTDNNGANTLVSLHVCGNSGGGYGQTWSCGSSNTGYECVTGFNIVNEPVSKLEVRVHNVSSAGDYNGTGHAIHVESVELN